MKGLSLIMIFIILTTRGSRGEDRRKRNENLSEVNQIWSSLGEYGIILKGNDDPIEDIDEYFTFKEIIDVTLELVRVDNRAAEIEVLLVHGDDDEIISSEIFISDAEDDIANVKMTFYRNEDQSKDFNITTFGRFSAPKVNVSLLGGGGSLDNMTSLQFLVDAARDGRYSANFKSQVFFEEMLYFSSNLVVAFGRVVCSLETIFDAGPARTNASFAFDSNYTQFSGFWRADHEEMVHTANFYLYDDSGYIRFWDNNVYRVNFQSSYNLDSAGLTIIRDSHVIAKGDFQYEFDGDCLIFESRGSYDQDGVECQYMLESGHDASNITLDTFCHDARVVHFSMAALPDQPADSVIYGFRLDYKSSEVARGQLRFDPPNTVVHVDGDRFSLDIKTEDNDVEAIYDIILMIDDVKYGIECLALMSYNCTLHFGPKGRLFISFSSVDNLVSLHTMFNDMNLISLELRDTIDLDSENDDYMVTFITYLGMADPISITVQNGEGGLGEAFAQHLLRKSQGSDARDKAINSLTSFLFLVAKQIMMT